MSRLCSQSLSPFPAFCTICSYIATTSEIAKDIKKKKTTKNSNRFVLVVVDLLTRVAEMIPLPNKSISQNCSQCSHMRDVFCRRGILGSILTDRGCQFDHQALRTIAHQLGIDKKHIWALHASPS